MYNKTVFRIIPDITKTLSNDCLKLGWSIGKTVKQRQCNLRASSLIFNFCLVRGGVRLNFEPYFTHPAPHTHHPLQAIFSLP